MGKITYAHRVAFAILPKVSGCLSMIGSTYIIQDILSDPAKQKRTYCRLLFGSSVFDVITSFMYFLSTWPIPAEEPALYAAGSTATCTAQGFFIQMSIAVPVYNLGLASYYFLVLVKNWQDSKLKRFEKYVHWLALILGVGTATAGLPLKLYNNSNLWCWISSLPMSCKGGVKADGGAGACQRGQSAWIYRWAFYYAPLWATIFTITVAMAIVTRHVFKTEKRSRKWQHKKANLRSLSNRVFWQSVHYVLAFYVTWIFPTTLRLLQTFGIAVPPFVIIGMCICLPLQGFWNAVTYAKPRLHNHRGSILGTRTTVLSGMSRRFNLSRRLSMSRRLSSMSLRFNSTRALNQSNPPMQTKNEENASSPTAAAVAQSDKAKTEVQAAELAALEDVGTWDPSYAFQRMAVVLSAQDLQYLEGSSQQLTMRDLTSTEFNSNVSSTTDVKEKPSQCLRRASQPSGRHSIDAFGDESVLHTSDPEFQNVERSIPHDSIEQIGDEIVPHPPGSKIQSVKESSAEDGIGKDGDENWPNLPGLIYCHKIHRVEESCADENIRGYGDEVMPYPPSPESQSVGGESSAYESAEEFGDEILPCPSGPRIQLVEESNGIVPQPPGQESSVQDLSLVSGGLGAPLRRFGSGILSSLRDECNEYNIARHDSRS